MENDEKLISELAEARQRYHALWTRISEENPKNSIAKTDHIAKSSNEARRYQELKMIYEIKVREMYEKNI